VTWHAKHAGTKRGAKKKQKKGGGVEVKANKSVVQRDSQYRYWGKGTRENYGRGERTNPRSPTRHGALKGRKDRRGQQRRTK